MSHQYLALRSIFVKNIVCPFTVRRPSQLNWLNVVQSLQRKTFCFLSFLACGSWCRIRFVLLSIVGHKKVVEQQVMIVVTP